MNFVPFPEALQNIRIQAARQWRSRGKRCCDKDVDGKFIRGNWWRGRKNRETGYISNRLPKNWCPYSRSVSIGLTRGRAKNFRLFFLFPAHYRWACFLGSLGRYCFLINSLSSFKFPVHVFLEKSDVSFLKAPLAAHLDSRQLVGSGQGINRIGAHIETDSCISTGKKCIIKFSLFHFFLLWYFWCNIQAD